MKNKQEALANEPIGKLFLKLSIPAILAQLVNLLYNLVDRIYIGHIEGVGDIALTGVGLTFPLIMFVSAFSSLCGMGGAPKASIAMGENNQKHANRILGNSLVVTITLALILTIVLSFFNEPLLFAFGASENTIVYAKDYMDIYSKGTIFVMISVGLNSFITTQGFSKYSMLNVIVGAVCNIILDPIFIFGLNMGVKGAALATIISQGVSAIMVLGFLFSKKSKLRINKESIIPNVKVILSCMALGLAPFIMQSTESILNICFNTSLKNYGGDPAVGAMTICTSLMMFAMMPLQGFTQGAQPIISYNYGAKNPERIKKTFKILIITCFTYALIYWLVVMIFPSALTSIFTNEEYLINYATNALRIYMACICLFGIQIACQQTFIALGNAPISLFLALLRKVILLIPLIYILPSFMENKVNAVFLAEPISDFVAVTTTLVTFFIVFKKTIKKISNLNKGSIKLESQRLILRKINKEDAEEIFLGFINQEEFLYWTNKNKRTLEEQIKSLEGIEEKYKNNHYYNWVITLKESKAIIGSINAHYVEEEDKVIINYGLDNRYFNNGYMSEALEKVLDYLHNDQKIKRIECGCCIENIPSKKVIEKNNMIYEGIIEKEVLLKDGYHDMYLYVLENK